MRVFGLGEFIQPLMKGLQALLKPQDGDQLLADAGETIGLQLCSLKLINHQSVSAQDQAHEQGQDERQTAAHVEGVPVWGRHSISLRSSPRRAFWKHRTVTGDDGTLFSPRIRLSIILADRDGSQ